jgi:hypothetical protein
VSSASSATDLPVLTSTISIPVLAPEYTPVYEAPAPDYTPLPAYTPIYEAPDSEHSPDYDANINPDSSEEKYEFSENEDRLPDYKDDFAPFETASATPTPLPAITTSSYIKPIYASSGNFCLM